MYIHEAVQKASKLPIVDLDKIMLVCTGLMGCEIKFNDYLNDDDNHFTPLMILENTWEVYVDTVKV